MFSILAALLVVAAPDSTVGPAADSAHRVVRRFPAVEVSAGRLNDMRSSATVHVITADALRDLPLSSFAQALALQPGVVAVGEDLHVRGGRAGETQVTLGGLTLNEPLRDRAPELPLLAVQRADLLAGGLDAEYMGSLAGVIDVHTWNPTPHASGSLRWLGSGRRGTSFDWLGGRASTPLPLGGLGFVTAGEVRLDDAFLPQRASRGRDEWLGQRFGWRNDNHLLGWAKLAPVANPQAYSIELFAARVVNQPYDPMFSWNDSVLIHTITPGPDTGGVPGQPRIAPPIIDSMNVFYRASDHEPMSETRRWTAVAQAGRLGPRTQWRASASWQHAGELVSPGLARTRQALLPADKVRFGQDFDPERDPFHAYGGAWPYYKRTWSERWQAACTATLNPTLNSRVGFGAGALRDEVDFYEYDSALPTDGRIDTVRQFHTRGSGGWAYVQHRWEHEGLVWNGGVRVQVYDPGREASVRLGVPAGSTSPQVRHAAGAIWTLSPRLGVAFPFGPRAAFSVSYARIHQPPAREFLADSRLLIYNRRPLGNPELQPSELVTYQAGVKHLFDERWAMQVSVFSRDLYGQIGIANDPYFTGTFRARYQNSEYGHATGIEVALLAGRRPEAASLATRAGRTLARRLTGEFSLRYTFMSAFGSMSGTDGWYYGRPFGFRPLPISEHALDWDRGHMLGLDAVWREPHAYTIALVMQLASGPRWTPSVAFAGQTSGPLLTPDLSAVNSRQLPWSERTDLALRFEPPTLHGARLLVDVRNLFDARGDAAVSVAGFPNPLVNTQRDDYGGYRTDTGNGGGGYWDTRLNGGAGGWVSVNDARLRAAPRSVRVGIELGM